VTLLGLFGAPIVIRHPGNCSLLAPPFVTSLAMGTDCGDESAESRGTVQPIHSPTVIRPKCRTSVVVTWTNGLLCCGYKWVSRFETSCIPTQWTGKRWVEQMPRLYGMAC